MSSARRMLSNLYLVIALIALIATWRQNIAFGAERGLSFAEMFVEFWPALFVNRATTSITVDIFLVFLACAIWMVLEARRLQLRLGWLYVFFGITVAISVTFPLFLFARERKLAQLAQSAETEPAPTLGDKLGLGLLTLFTFAVAAWSTLR